MIKLIASDMDGSLLTDDKRFPPDFDLIMRRLGEKNIHFAAASGRSFSTLKINFERFGGKLDFICDNGAYVVIDGRVESVSLLNPKKVRELLELCRSMTGVIPVLCGKNGIYFENYRGILNDEVAKFYLRSTCVEDITSVRDDFFKVAIYDEVSSRENSYPIISEHFDEEFTLAVSGPHWMDLMNKGINKGSALKLIQDRLGVTPAETMTFGDYFNDVELLQGAEYSFVMANAHPDMFRYGNYRAKSNEEYGVAEAIKKYAL